MTKKRLISQFLPAILLIWVVQLGAFHTVNGQFQAEDGLYISLGASYQSLGGDFDGEAVLVAPDDIFLVPKIEPALGVGIKIGYRVEMAAVELSLFRGQHDASWVGASDEAVFSLWSLNFQYYFLPESPLQPFLQLGWAPVTALRAKDAAALVSTMEVSDAIFISEIGNFNAGGGVVYYFTPKAFLQATVLYYKLGYGSIESEAERVAIEIDKTLKAKEIHFQFGIAYTF